MKEFVLAIFSIFALNSLWAQDNIVVTSSESRPIKESLERFSAIDVDAPIKLKLTKIADDQTPYIIFDTKGDYTTKFSAVVDAKSSTLKISERADAKRVTVTEVHLFFNTLSSITIAKADTTIDGVIDAQLLDVTVTNNAHLTAEINVLDLKLYISGKSRVVLRGNTQYQSADISTAEYNGRDLYAKSTIVESLHNAVVRVDASERLEIRTVTGGRVYYYSVPPILRTEITTFGGEIVLIQ